MGYQETIHVEIENISSKKQLFWRPIYEVIENSYFAATKLFLPECLDQCRNNTNETQKIPDKIKVALKK